MVVFNLGSTLLTEQLLNFLNLSVDLYFQQHFTILRKYVAFVFMT